MALHKPKMEQLHLQCGWAGDGTAKSLFSISPSAYIFAATKYQNFTNLDDQHQSYTGWFNDYSVQMEMLTSGYFWGDTSGLSWFPSGVIWDGVTVGVSTPSVSIGLGHTFYWTQDVFAEMLHNFPVQTNEMILFQLFLDNFKVSLITDPIRIEKIKRINNIK